MRLAISAAAEGFLDEIVLRKVCRVSGIDIHRMYPCRGKSDLDRKLPGYNQAAKGWYWLVLRDLNHDANCAPELRNRLLPQPADRMLLCIAVPQVESWLLADSQRFGVFVGIPTDKILPDPETLADAKGEVLRLAEMYGSRSLREDLLPRVKTGAKEGPGYASRLAEFTERFWRPRVAARASDSLCRCLRRLGTWRRSATRTRSRPEMRPR
jgi:hypothetical protein